MVTPESIAIFGLIVSSIVFYVYAIGVNQQKFTLDGFLLYDRGLNKSQFGKTASKTGDMLGISRRTVEGYFENIKKKLHVEHKYQILETIN